MIVTDDLSSYNYENHVSILYVRRTSPWHATKRISIVCERKYWRNQISKYSKRRRGLTWRDWQNRRGRASINNTGGVMIRGCQGQEELSVVERSRRYVNFDTISPHADSRGHWLAVRACNRDNQ